ncbi:hypothetical protein JRQ81_008258 [Phrynocephalus forsythii]|uniref:Eosinophil peroxidase n=1 Tax=Phrynocephalus forsythii TaxID=171643 RepID=A0A9Q0XEY0_9SAUR|nr:hypothetical protein JRQ81_008258 [Phrynocephalus forsythii]
MSKDTQAMKLHLVALLAFLVAPKALGTGHLSLRALAKSLGTSTLLQSVEEAKRLVDYSYGRTQARLREKLRRQNASPADILVSFKQPVGKTRAAVQAADYMHVALALLKETLQSAVPGDFNVTDLLTPAQMLTIYKATGCSHHDRQTTQCDDKSPYRTITGECNNKRIQTLGASNRPYARWLLQEYEDGVSLPRGWTGTKRYNGFLLPNVRQVSNAIVRFPNEKLTDDKSRSVMFMQWGQFIDHDMDFGPGVTATLTFMKGVDCDRSCAKAPPCFPIVVLRDARTFEGHKRVWIWSRMAC